ncbi:hypothetical protein PIB30_026637 [Stylosanthes scabra]|uniref:Syringolide-induced protein 14-1-1 n=1 Tax=Stylosanthes scabra TaxID=79078 RepID=A0ABU6YCM1_9FABA|nr:hypothetical protein [Stylosanthes scabra]
MENNNNKQNSSSSWTLRSKILKILPKAAAAVHVTFQNPPFSPGKDHQSGSSRLKAPSSGPVMIPEEARRKPKHGGMDTQEPTSPKVSCIGQIKSKKKRIINKHNNNDNNITTTKKEGSNKFQRMFFHTGKPKKSCAAPSSTSSCSLLDQENSNGPPIGHMRRFASSRETFSSFDWKAQIEAEDINNKDCYSEDERPAATSDIEDEHDEEEVVIPFSAPIGGRGGCSGAFGGRGDHEIAANLNVQPRKEINLWKRRTMAPPRPLQLKPLLLTAK